MVPTSSVFLAAGCWSLMQGVVGFWSIEAMTSLSLRAVITSGSGSISFGRSALV
jgi:hypothetical protein